MARVKFIKTVKAYLEEIDITLLVSVLLLSGISVINMYGVVGTDDPIFTKHIIFIFAGLVVMTIFSFFNYRYLKNYSLPVLILYLFSLFLLGLTFFSGSIRGTNSWIVLGSLTFEPAELTKLCLIILMAKYFSQKHVHINQLRHIIA